MEKEIAIRYFGSLTALASAIRRAPSTVSEWGPVVPELYAYKLHVITAGRRRNGVKLRIDRAVYEGE